MRDKRERFVALAEARIRKASQLIRLIGNLANRNNYEYSEADAAKIMAALDAELKLLRSKFHAGSNRAGVDRFKLD